MTQKSNSKKQSEPVQDNIPQQPINPLGDEPTQQDILMREVDEAMRQERLKTLWDEYGNLLIGSILALILATAAFSGYNSLQTSRNKAATENLMLLNDTDTATLPEGLNAAQTDLARLILTSSDDQDTARAQAEALAQNADTIVNQTLGTLLAVRLSDAPAQERLQRLQNLIAEETGPLAALAAIDAAVILGEELQNKSQASHHLSLARDKADGNPTLVGMIDRLAPLYRDFK